MKDNRTPPKLFGQDFDWYKKYAGNYIIDENGYPMKIIEPVEILATNNKKVTKKAKELKGKTKNKNYSIVDKELNKIYNYNSKGVLQSTESVITGKNQGDTFTAPSFKEFSQNPEYYDKNFKTNTFLNNFFNSDNKKLASFKNYLDWLEENKQKNTPAGLYEISSYKDNVSENPSKKDKFFRDILSIFANIGASTDSMVDFNDNIRKNRQVSYGDGRMLTLKDADTNLGQSWAIHSTGSPERLELLNNNEGGALSGGCINTKCDTKIFDHLKDGGNVFVLPQESEDLPQVYKSKSKFKNNIAKILHSKGFDINDDLVSYIGATSLKESRGNKSKFAKYVEPTVNTLTGGRYAKSLGEMQINPEPFVEYLPNNYHWKNRGDQIEAVANFYNKNIGKANTLSREPAESLYSFYNSGKFDNTSKPIRAFTKKFNYLKGK